MTEKPDHVAEADLHYRRGLVLGFTMAEVMILILFCLLLTSLYLMRQKDDKIRALGDVEAGRAFVVAIPVLQRIERQFQPVSSQTELDDDFDKLLNTNDQVRQIEKQVSDTGFEFGKTTDLPTKIKALASVAKMARDVTNSSGRQAKSPDQIGDSLASSMREINILIKAKRLGSVTRIEDRNLVRSAIAGELCDAEYENPQQQAECRKKIVALAGGKGLEYQSCWWDKATTPWKTKNIFDVALTDRGFIVRNLDPGVDEYRSQRASLPISEIETGQEISEASFLAETERLLAWSNQNKCRFFVRLFDRTASDAKATYRARLDAVERRFYKENTGKLFSVVE